MAILSEIKIVQSKKSLTFVNKPIQKVYFIRKTKLLQIRQLKMHQGFNIVLDEKTVLSFRYKNIIAKLYLQSKCIDLFQNAKLD